MLEEEKKEAENEEIKRRCLLYPNALSNIIDDEML
jgi:hypothetical protein